MAVLAERMIQASRDRRTLQHQQTYRQHHCFIWLWPDKPEDLDSDLPYFDEISFIANPHKVITLLELEELYGKKLEISE